MDWFRKRIVIDRGTDSQIASLPPRDRWRQFFPRAALR